MPYLWQSPSVVPQNMPGDPNIPQLVIINLLQPVRYTLSVTPKLIQSQTHPLTHSSTQPNDKISNNFLVSCTLDRVSQTSYQLNICS